MSQGPASSPSVSRRRQRGVSLVELMVAMVVGSLVILAAGSLFQEVNANAREVLRLADRQAVLSYALDTITAAVRRGDASPGDYVLRPAPDGETCTLHEVDSGEPLVDGLAYDGSCEDDQVLEDLGGGLYRITLNLPHARTPIRLHAVDRLQAVSAAEADG